MHGTSILDIDRKFLFNNSAGGRAGADTAREPTRPKSMAANVAGAPTDMAQEASSTVEKLRLDWRDVQFNERLYLHALNKKHDIHAHSTSAHTHGGAGVGVNGLSSIDSNALKTAADVPLVTGDVFRLGK